MIDINEKAHIHEISWNNGCQQQCEENSQPTIFSENDMLHLHENRKN